QMDMTWRIFNPMVERSQTALLDDTYASLSHPVRREMVEILSEAPHRVTEVAAPFDVSLEPAQLRDWMGPLTDVQVDPKVGGRFRIVMGREDADGGPIEHTGE